MRTLKLNNPEMSVYVKSMGKFFRVTAICKSDAEANRILELDSSQTVIASDCNGLVYLAGQYESVYPSALINDQIKAERADILLQQDKLTLVAALKRLMIDMSNGSLEQARAAIASAQPINPNAGIPPAYPAGRWTLKTSAALRDQDMKAGGL